MITAHKDLNFDTPEGRARLVARALCSSASRDYHDDIPKDEYPSEDMLTSALQVLLPLFGSIRVPEQHDGELGGVLLTVTPVQHMSITIYPPSTDGPEGGTSIALYKPPALSTVDALQELTRAMLMLAQVGAQHEDDDAPASGSVH